MNPTKHNYYKKLLKLYEQGEIPSASFTEVDICHDDWCGIHSGDYCNCDPDIKPHSQPIRTGHDTGQVREGVGSINGSRDEDTQPLQPPTTPCPHCGSKEFILWKAADDPEKQAISCNRCRAVMSSTHPLDPDDRPMRRP